MLHVEDCILASAFHPFLSLPLSLSPLQQHKQEPECYSCDFITLPFFSSFCFFFFLDVFLHVRMYIYIYIYVCIALYAYALARLCVCVGVCECVILSVIDYVSRFLLKKNTTSIGKIYRRITFNNTPTSEVCACTQSGVCRF